MYCSITCLRITLRWLEKLFESLLMTLWMGSISDSRNSSSYPIPPILSTCPLHTNKQPIMRTEDRLFDRGWVRSAMATRKCGNIYFPKYFMAVRPFFTRIFFQELFGLEGSKHFLGKFRQVHNLKISNHLLRSKSFFQKNISGFICSVCVPFLGN